ncbi:MAG: acetyl-CoA C-acyltransferase [Acidimicrobiaceae bacterium]|nr:acetyl-CoA C-acyltransferase [Acidimicrobiaceae bacterium]
MSGLNEVVIVDAVRSATAKRNGRLSSFHVTKLLGDVLVSLIDRNNLDPSIVDHVAGGCIAQVGMQANNVTRTSWLAAGLPVHVGASTTTTQCGSGQHANTWAHSLISSGMAEIVIVCGVESMSHVPMASQIPIDANGEAYLGERYTDEYKELYDPTNQLEGAERIAEKWGLTREELDHYGARSQQLAAQAWQEGRFDGQIVPFSISEDGSEIHDRDEGLRETTFEGLSKLSTIAGASYFDEAAKYHTAGTASQLADAASALLVMSASKADELGLSPMARVVSSCLVGSDPELMLTGPIAATQKLLQDSGYTKDDIDIFEVNEAFASVVLAWAKELEIEVDDRVNPNGGAIAIGHALGSTGPLLITKTVHELQRSGGRLGLISMCCGGGLGTGTLVERL